MMYASFAPRASRRSRFPRSSRLTAVLLALSTTVAGAMIPLLAPVAAAATPPTVGWLARYTGNGAVPLGNNQVDDMVTDAAGNVYVTGNSSGNDWDVSTLKYDPAGNVLWTAVFNGAHNGVDVPRAIAVDAQGNVYVAGYTDGNGESNLDYLTLKYNSLGVLQWSAEYAAPGNFGDDEARGIAVDGTGNVYVTGLSAGPGSGLDIATVKYSPAGAQLWERRYDGPSHMDDGAFAIAIGADGGIYLTGFSDRSPGNDDAVTMKYDPSGLLVWSDRFNGPFNGSDRGVAIKVDATQNVYVAGATTDVAGRYDGLLIKLSPTGAETWVRRYDDPVHGNDQLHALAFSPVGKICVTGFASPTGADSDYLTQQYEPDGTLDWTALYDGPVHGFDSASGIATDAAGNVYVTGDSDGGKSNGLVNYDYATLRYSATGATDWTVRYDGTGDWIDVGVKVATGPDGSVYVAGWSDGTRGGNSQATDFVTIRYDQAGVTAVDPPASAPGTKGLTLVADGSNPFRAFTELALTLPADGPVDLTLVDAQGPR